MFLERGKHPWECSGSGVLEGTPTWEGNVLNGIGVWAIAEGCGREVSSSLCEQQHSQAALLPFLALYDSARMMLLYNEWPIGGEARTVLTCGPWNPS